MATLNEIAYDILNSMSGGRTSDDNFISIDQIKYNVNYYRSLFLHRDLNKSVFEDYSFYQKVELEFIYDQINDVYMSTEPLPKILRLSHRYPIRIGGFKNIPVTLRNSLRFNQYNRYTKNKNKAYLEHDVLFIFSNRVIDKLEVEAIFENPSEAYIFAGKDPLSVDDLEYPCSSDVVQRLTGSILNRSVELLQIPADIKQDNAPTNTTGN